uniref:Uncharacterized protein n=1 Tax=Pararge aegeria TaxID=116150 RepID=S4PCJ8_9NEOP
MLSLRNKNDHAYRKIKFIVIAKRVVPSEYEANDCPAKQTLAGRKLPCCNFKWIIFFASIDSLPKVRNLNADDVKLLLV